MAFLVSFVHRKSKHQENSTYTQPWSPYQKIKPTCHNLYQYISSLHGSFKESRVQKCSRKTQVKFRVEAHTYCSLTDFRWYQLASLFFYFFCSSSRECFIGLVKFSHTVCCCCFVLFLKSLTYIFITDIYYTLAVKKHCKVLVNFSELTE